MGANLSLAASLVGGPPWTSIPEKSYAQKYQELFLFSKYFQTNLIIQKYSTVLDRQWTFVAVQGHFGEILLSKPHLGK